MSLPPTDSSAGTAPAWWTQHSPGGEADALGPRAEVSGDEGLGFFDLIDVINPLHHIPVVGTIYRSLTGDQISDAARMAGSAVYGGPMGLVAALTDSVVKAETGRDMGETAVAWASGGTELDAGTGGGPVMLAMAEPTLTPAAAPAGSAATRAAWSGANLASDAAADTATDTATDPAPGQLAPALAQPGRLGAPAAPGAIAAAPAPGPEIASLNGRNADRLDAFIRRANAIRSPEAPQPPASQGGNTLAALPSTPSGTDSVSDWMQRALDKYETMKRSETS